jgi:hypothetical protein
MSPLSTISEQEGGSTPVTALLNESRFIAVPIVFQLRK